MQQDQVLEMRGDWSYPTRVVFGAGCRRELPEQVRGWGQRALIVTDPGVIGSGTAQPVMDVLAAAGISYRVFDGVESNPTREIVLAGAERFREGCHFIIALGGGSPMDTAKAVALAATHPGELEQYVERHGGAERISDELPPMVAIPTTAGTGSEIARSTVITLNGRKEVIFSPHLMPTVALCDPELTLNLPARPTAGTGADALTHCLEAYFARAFHPFCDALALDGMRRAFRWLPVAVREGHNLRARSEMMIAALMGGLASQKDLGAVHSLSHPLSTVAGVHHGVANALMLPFVLRFNQGAIAARAGAVADALSLGGPEAGEGAVQRVVEGLTALFHEIGLPSRLAQVNVTSALIGPMSELALEDECHRTNPRPVTREDLAGLYRCAL